MVPVSHSNLRPLAVDHVVLSTENKAKVASLRSVLSAKGVRYSKFHTIPWESGVDESPVNEETVEGAQNRATAAAKWVSDELRYKSKSTCSTEAEEEDGDAWTWRCKIQRKCTSYLAIGLESGLFTSDTDPTKFVEKCVCSIVVGDVSGQGDSHQCTTSERSAIGYSDSFALPDVVNAAMLAGKKHREGMDLLRWNKGFTKANRDTISIYTDGKHSRSETFDQAIGDALAKLQQQERATSAVTTTSKVQEYEAQLDSSRDIRALIFDCDGTLVNSMEFFYAGWSKVCAKWGLEFPKSQFYALAGRPIDLILREVFRANGREAEYSDELNQKFLAEKFEVVKGMKAEGVFPGEIESVTNIVKKNFAKKGTSAYIPMAVASSGDRAHVHADLKKNGLFDYFDWIVTVEDVPAGRGKPNPDLFLLAWEKLNVEPRYCRGFEDWDLGMQWLAAAGMEAIDVRKFATHPTQAIQELN